MDKKIIDSVFKNYDVRGFADSQITEELAYAIGNAFVQQYNLRTCAVGRDVRISSPKLTEALIKGILDAGCDVVDLGIVSTPLIKWIIAEKKFPGGIMVSASHNPPQYNGFKIFEKDALPLGEAHGLHKLKALLDSSIKKTQGERKQANYLDDYVTFLLRFLKESTRPFFVDTSGGCAGRELKALMERGSFNFITYNTDEDPNFSVHPPDPLNPKATEYAQNYCKTHKMPGAVLDADADRIIMIDENGSKVSGDLFGAYLCSKILKKGESATSTVRDSRAMKETTLAMGGTFELNAVGHANIHRAMARMGSHVGTEKSGHVFLKEAHYSEATLLCILLVLKHLGEQTLAEAMEPFTSKYITSPEINSAVRDTKEVIEAAKKHYETKGELITIDGVLCEGDGWWVNIRPSNTEPLIRLTFEAQDKDTYDELEKEAHDLIAPFKSGEQPSH